MPRRVIVLGDATSHGGKVLTGSPSHTIHGKPIARQGDMVSCPKPGHGENAIAEGDPGFVIDGRPVALEGHRSACGCSLIGSVDVTRP